MNVVTGRALDTTLVYAALKLDGAAPAAMIGLAKIIFPRCPITVSRKSIRQDM